MARNVKVYDRGTSCPSRDRRRGDDLLAKGTPSQLLLLPVIASAFALSYFLTSSVLFVWASVGSLVVFFVLLLFFRDFDRPIGDGIVSPADGRVMAVEKEKGRHRISIFMNLHNVHVNRAPWDGTVVSVDHVPGSFRPAFDKDSDRNERVIIKLRTSFGTIEVVQIAGAMARRIVPYVSKGDDLVRGQRIGLIRFGSRVDLRFDLPKGMHICVKKGDRVMAGRSNLASYEVPKGM